MKAVVYALRAEDVPLVERSLRCLRWAGLGEGEVVVRCESLARFLKGAREEVLLLQAGAWLMQRWMGGIPRSDTGLALVGYGRTHGDSQWRAWERQASETEERGCPPWRCVYLEAAAARAFGGVLEVGCWEDACDGVWRRGAVRCVGLGALANQYDGQLRVMQMVTSLQVGGAERVALDLAEGLNLRGERAWVGVTRRAPRKTFAVPPGLIDLSGGASDARELADAVWEVVERLHLDVVHAHLLSGQECEALLKREIPLVTTLHNAAQAWPDGVQAGRGLADLLVACSQQVAHDVRRAGLREPCRTAWNGILEAAWSVREPAVEERRVWRQERGWAETDLVIASVANPRAQKRLEWIPEMVVELQKALPDRQVRWVLAGEAARSSAGAQAAQQLVEEAVDRYGVRDRVEQTAGASAVRPLLWAADVFLSTSAFEGLSLAHLEALAAGLPVVATDVGGAGEIAGEMGVHAAFYQRVEVSASVGRFVEALLRAPQRVWESRLPRAFERSQMVNRVRELYVFTLFSRLRKKQKAKGIWFVTNNFSMGGAQSSARRLMEALQGGGTSVKAFTLEEACPTQGTLDLRSRGVEVEALPVSCLRNPVDASLWLGALSVVEPPEAVFFWNAVPAVKIHVADALFGVRVVDVSPGEMFFASLERYFGSPMHGVPYRCGREYGAVLAGAVVKYARERECAQRELGCPVWVVPNGVRALEDARMEEAVGVLRIGTACRISPQKRLEALFEALGLAHARMPPYELHVAGRVEHGAQEYAQGLRSMASALPVVWCGELPGTESFLKRIHLFVMISEPAGCPNASLEAMAAGLPVVATDFGGAHEQVIDGVTGRLTPRGDAAALAEALVELAHDAPKRARFGSAGKERVVREFSLEKMASGYLEVARASEGMGNGGGGARLVGALRSTTG